MQKFHGRRSLVDYSPWGHKELDTTERLHFPRLFNAKNIKKKKTEELVVSIFKLRKFPIKVWAYRVTDKDSWVVNTYFWQDVVVLVV